MKIFNKKIVSLILIILVIFSFMFNKKEDKVVVLDDVKVISNNDKFAIQYQVNGEYEKIDKFLGKEDGYFLNTTLSKCQDKDGKIIDNNLEYDNNKKTIVMETTNSTYCYLYFDEEENISNLCRENQIKDCISNLTKINNLNGDQADMYRYQGSYTEVNNNYICFGTDDVNVCKNDEDKYMYRIIGITEDGKLELIKKTALTRNGTQWHSIFRTTWNTDVSKNEKITDTDVPWSKSDLFKRLNGLSSNNDNLFIGNNNFDYLDENSEWFNKILDTDWLSGKLDWNNAYFQPSNLYNIEKGDIAVNYYEEASPYYYNGGINNVSEDAEYLERRSKDSIKCVRYDTVNINEVTCFKEITNKTFDNKIKAKIGLMHLYDYEYSVEKDGKNCFINVIWNGQDETYKEGSNGEKCLDAWMHLSNNDAGLKDFSAHEWTISLYGFAANNDSFDAWRIDNNGVLVNAWVSGYLTARPVFYLTNTITIKSGNGSINNPYILSEK